MVLMRAAKDALAHGLLLLLPGCALLVGNAAEQLADDLRRALLEQTDPAIVRDGAPAYLLLVDGLIDGAPESEELLLAGARLYGAYATAFVEDPERARRLTERALDYARRALCLELAEPCTVLDRPYGEFVPALAGVRREDVPVLYAYATAWAGWLQVRADDWRAVAEVPKLEALVDRILELDEAYDGGNAHVYLGVLLAQRPAGLGGRPEKAREHFERAIELSEGRNLIVQTLYAESYARLVFDRPLHDRLLQEVVAADPRVPGWTLSNTLAQERARELLAAADDYF